MSKRTRRAVLVIALAAVAAWITAVVLSLAAAARDAGDGIDAIDAARERDISEPADLVEPLTEARAAFASAHDRASSILVAPARVLPWFGRQIGAVRALANAAADVADAGIQAATDAEAVLSRPLGRGGARVEGLRDLAGVTRRARDRIAAVDPGPGKDLLGVLADKHATFVEDLEQARDALDTATSGLGVLADLLGGPRTILVLGANNAEMRAGSGMFLTVGTMRARNGRLSLAGTRSVADVQPPPGAVRPTGDYRDRWGWLMPGDDWRNLMLSPRFDASAPMATRIWRAATGRTVDVVLALDPIALRALLEVTGPVRADGRRITDDNVIGELLARQYERFVGANPERREALGEIARAVFAALNTRDVDPLVLFDALSTAVRGRHLMAWSQRPAEQDTFARAHIDGALAPDSMMLSVLNRGGNKLDRYLRVRAELTITSAGEGAQGVLDITIRNAAPRGLPAYVQGPSAEHATAAGEYLAFVAVTLPGFSGEGRMDGADRIVALGADGPTRVVAGEARIRRGETKTLRVRFRFASASGSIRIEASAREPATTWRYRDDTWRDHAARAIRFV